MKYTTKVATFFTVVLLILFATELAPVTAQSWLTGWSYRKSHEIVGSTAGAQTDYQIRIKVHYGSGVDDAENVYLNGKCRTDFGDIRFTDINGNELPYWMEEKTDGDFAVFWVKVPSIPASPNTTQIYIYYGNPSAATTSNGEATFLFFDDFEAGNLNKWTKNAGNGYIQLETANPLGGSYSAKLGQPVNDKNQVFMYEVVSRSNIAIRARVYIDARVDFGGAGLYARGDGTRSTANPDHPGPSYTAGISARDNKAFIRIGKSDAKQSELASVPMTVNLDTEYKLEFRLYGSSLKLFVDGVEKVSVTDATYASGYNGLWIIESETIFDDVFVRKYVDPEPSHGAWGSEETYGGNNPPYAPILTSPEENFHFNPSATVTFTWTFNDPDSGDSQSAYEFQLDDDSDFSSPIIDTGKVSSGTSSTTQTLPSTVGLYYWRVKTWDSQDAEGAWSSGRTIIVDRIKVNSLTADDTRLDVGATVTLTVQLVYEYDNTAITSGSFTLNGLTLTHQGSGTWTATDSKSTVQAITYDTVSGSVGNLNTVNMNGKSVTVIWDGLNVSSYQIDMAEQKVYVKLIYASDGSVVNGGTVSLAGLQATTNSSGWAVFDMSVADDFAWNQTAYGVQDGQYGITFKALNQSLPIARKGGRLIWSDAEITGMSYIDYMPVSYTHLTLPTN